jgi:hypothetical protein
MCRNIPHRHAGRDRLLVASNRGEGRPRADAPEVRWTVNIKDGVPVLPRTWRPAVHLAGQYINYDPEAEKLGVAGHMETLAWLQEAREELARTKNRPAELHALLERAIAIVSVTGK